MPRLHSFAFAFLLVIVACDRPAANGDPPAHDAASASAFTWPVPEGWRKETIPFPLDFAPDLPYRGVEEIRFAPGFFAPGAPGYFSYAFVWWLEGRPELDRASLERDLAHYFAGLCAAVGGKARTFDAARFKATLEALPDARGFRGTIDTYDPFEKGGGRELTLDVELSTRDCGAAGHRALIVEASPRPRTDVIWRALEERAAAFQCR